MTDRELWAKAPRSLIDRRWKQAHLLVYLYLDLCAGRRGWWRTTQEVIAENLGFSRRSVETAVSDLRSAGLITTRREGNIAGEITYGIVSRVPQEIAVPMDSDPHDTAGRFRSVVRVRSNLSSYTSPQTSSIEDPFAKVVNRSWPRDEQRKAN